MDRWFMSDLPWGAKGESLWKRLADANTGVPGPRVRREILYWKRLQSQAMHSRWMSRYVSLFSYPWLLIDLLMFWCLAEWKIEQTCNATLDHSGKELRALYSPEKVVIKRKWIKCYYKGNGGKKTIIFMLSQSNIDLNSCLGECWDTRSFKSSSWR